MQFQESVRNTCDILGMLGGNKCWENGYTWIEMTFMRMLRLSILGFNFITWSDNYGMD